ncbi:MAG: group II intron maturase-specific domain-containing protein, partial [Solirubrobacteraceae bacterium]
MPNRLDPSAAPRAWTGFVLSNARSTVVLSRTRIVASAHDLAQGTNLVLRGWFAYFTAFYPTAVIPLCQRIDRHLERWAR